MSDNKKNNHDHEDVGLYEKFVARTEELIDSGRKNLDDALKRAGDDLTAAGNFTREKSEKIASYVKKDIQQAVENAEKAGNNIKEAVEPKRVAAGAQSIVSRVLSSTAETLSEWAQKSERQLEFKTGEITGAGTLTCKECSEQVHLKKASRIPPCPKCHGVLFRKSY